MFVIMARESQTNEWRGPATLTAKPVFLLPQLEYFESRLRTQLTRENLKTQMGFFKRKSAKRSSSTGSADAAKEDTPSSASSTATESPREEVNDVMRIS